MKDLLYNAILILNDLYLSIVVSVCVCELYRKNSYIYVGEWRKAAKDISYKHIKRNLRCDCVRIFVLKMH